MFVHKTDNLIDIQPGKYNQKVEMGGLYLIQICYT